MASRVQQLAGHLIGKKLKNAGAHLYHAKDGAADGGVVTNSKSHRIRKALHRHRLRASGMTDDIFGSKEVGGAFENSREQDD